MGLWMGLGNVVNDATIVQESESKAKINIESAQCMWKGCSGDIITGLNILEHLQTVHVTPTSSPEGSKEGFACMWEGCKVFGRKSSSLSWLERHVLSRHSGNKPFKCIFPGCGLSFGVQGALQRHVNIHFSNSGLTNGSHVGHNGASMNKLISSSSHSTTTTHVSNNRRKQKKNRSRIRPMPHDIQSGNHVDYFDKRTMEVIKRRLAIAASIHFQFNPHDFIFRGQVIARSNVNGEQQKVLVHWYPENIIKDEWILAVDEDKLEKTISLTRIPKEKLAIVYPTIFPPSSTSSHPPAIAERVGRKSRRLSKSPSTSSASSSPSINSTDEL